MARTSVRTHSFSTETWNTRKGAVQKSAVRVAKGDPSGKGGTFQGATNLRGSALPVIGVTLVKSA